MRYRGVTPCGESSVELERSLGAQLFESGEELAGEHRRHGTHREEELRLGRTPPLRRIGVGQSATGDQAVEVGMIHEVPGELWAVPLQMGS